MEFHVGIKMLFPPEALSTISTLMYLVIPMDHHVTPKGSLRLEKHLAHGAHVVLFNNMSGHVIFLVAQSAEFLGAL